MTNTIITSTLVTEDERLNFYSAAFGETNIIRGESLAFGYMKHFSKKYKGGYWHFYTLSNSGYYMAPAIETPIYLEIADNRFSGFMSADAAGIVVSLFVFAHLAAEDKNEIRIKTMVDRYFALKDYAFTHTEVSKILDAIN